MHRVGNVGALLRLGEIQRRLAQAVSAQAVRPGLQQHLHHLQISFQNRCVKRRDAGSVCAVDVEVGGQLEAARNDSTALSEKQLPLLRAARDDSLKNQRFHELRFSDERTKLFNVVEESGLGFRESLLAVYASMLSMPACVISDNEAWSPAEINHVAQNVSKQLRRPSFSWITRAVHGELERTYEGEGVWSCKLIDSQTNWASHPKSDATHETA
jgi:hypothetical protein